MRTDRRSDVVGGERGVTAVLFALFLVVLLTTAALVVDLGSSRQIARRIQSSGDAAALAAAQELALRSDGADAPIARSVAAGYAARNLHGGGAVATPVTCPPGSGAVEANTACYESAGSSIVVETPVSVPDQPLAARHFIAVRICEDTPTYFAATVGLRAPRVCDEAVARRYQAGLNYGRGLLTVDPEACPGFEVQGDSDVNIFSGGGVFVDAACDTAMIGTGAKWKLTASHISMVGAYDFNACSDSSCTGGDPPLVHQPPVGDPLRDLEPPPRPLTPASCVVSAGETRCSPGYYVDAPRDFGSGNGAVVLEPGIHWFAYGVDFGNLQVRVEGPESLDPEDGSGPGLGTGLGALVYADTGTIDLSGNGEVDLTPPTTGTYEGISIFTGRGNVSPAKVTGTTGSTIGTIYTPDATLVLGGSTGWTVTGMVVASKVTVFGNLTLQIDPDEPAAALPPVEDLGLER